MRKRTIMIVCSLLLSVGTIAAFAPAAGATPRAPRAPIHYLGTVSVPASVRFLPSHTDPRMVFDYSLGTESARYNITTYRINGVTHILQWQTWTSSNFSGWFDGRHVLCSKVLWSGNCYYAG